MCQDFSCIVTQSYQVLWKRGLSSHDQIYSAFKDDYPELLDNRNVKVEIMPDKGYLYPEGKWTFTIDEKEIPSWFSGEHKLATLRTLGKWKKEVYALINLNEARNPINPFKIRKYKVSIIDIENLKKWTLIRDSVWNSFEYSVGTLIRYSVGTLIRDLVWAYIGSLFDIWDGDYKYQPAVDLWRRGFVPSFDGKTWRLHAGKNADIVYEWTSEKER